MPEPQRPLWDDLAGLVLARHVPIRVRGVWPLWQPNQVVAGR
jgi:hypothetical protein